MADGRHGKRRKAPILLGLALSGALTLGACGEEGLPEVTPEEGGRVAQVGEAAAGELLRTLVGRLTAAMEEGGAAHAVEFCSREAMPITRLVETGREGGVVLKRTSFRYRNPENAPDAAEELALRYFEDAVLAGGEQPSMYVQRASETELRFYKPLFLGDFCLQCHGDPEAMAPEVREKIEASYPGDLATGYKAGDFRGVVRVSVPATVKEG